MFLHLCLGPPGPPGPPGPIMTLQGQVVGQLNMSSSSRMTPVEGSPHFAMGSGGGGGGGGGQCGCTQGMFLSMANQIRSIMPPGPPGSLLVVIIVAVTVTVAVVVVTVTVKVLLLLLLLLLLMMLLLQLLLLLSMPMDTIPNITANLRRLGNVVVAITAVDIVPFSSALFL